MFSDESEDAFEPSPLPSKRRKLNQQSDVSDTDIDAPKLPRRSYSHAKDTPEATDHEGSVKAKKAPKPKRLVHIHANPIELEDEFCTQALDPLPSSPWRIRGARWQKPAPASDARQDEAMVHEDSAHLQVSNTECKTGLIGCSSLDAHAPVVQNLVADQRSGARVAPLEFDFAKELEDLPSDAFSSSSGSFTKSPLRDANDVISISSSQPQGSPAKRSALVAPKNGLQQMTLFGKVVRTDDTSHTTNKVHNWPLARREEPPTHHKLDYEAMKTYIYPTNLGKIRDYQFSIVKRGLYHNLLVALPTGLGKTFIAATIMLNWWRWTTDSQIVFVAPTRPLVSQQVQACFGIAGIPKSQTSMLTGTIAPGLRAEEWASKRVFFTTPQTIGNDLKTGICDPKRIVLLVVDEAHRATGNYSYVDVVRFLRRFNQSFRILALTATPGASIEAVQEVINGLYISRVEIRTEFSIDIREYVHSRNTEVVTFDNSEEMERVMDLFAKALSPLVQQLRAQNSYWTADPMTLTAYGLTQARQRWMAGAGRNANPGLKAMINRIFTVLASLAHSIELLKYHGIGPFYHNVLAFQNSLSEAKGGGKYERQIVDSEHFKKMMTAVGFWIRNDSFIGHPKLEHLQQIALNHFLDAGNIEGTGGGRPPSATRIMIFAHYRDSAEEIARVLRRHEPMIRPHVFVGQAASKGSEGMDQKRQLEVIHDFKMGKYNTLVATSIGEEGLDIGEIDLIICYDSSSSPIRMLQRMGRTGRKRAGNILLLLMKGKEERSFSEAKDNYEKMQKMISEGTRFEFHEETDRRIVPKGIEPVVDKRVVDIPVENTQGDLPEPKKRGRPPKRPPKKFHMPDGVRTGFTKASRMDAEDSDELTSGPKSRRKTSRAQVREVLEPVVPLNEVLLNSRQMDDLFRKYQDIPCIDGQDVIVERPSLGAFPTLQWSSRPIHAVGHGKATSILVSTLRAMHSVNMSRVSVYRRYAKELDMGRLCRNPRVVDVEPRDKQNEPRPALAKNQNKPSSMPKGAVAKKKGPVKKRPAKTNEQMWPVMQELEDAAEADPSSPPATDPRFALATQGIDLGSDTSGEDEIEGEPSSDLRDFVVNSGDEDEDEGDIGSDGSTISSLASIRLRSNGHQVAHRDRATFSKQAEDARIAVFDADDTDGGDLPSLNTLVQNTGRDSNSVVPRKRKGDLDTTKDNTRRKRKVVEDSSD